MKLAAKIQEVFTSYLENFDLAWWIEIVTFQPDCTYYFGPFLSKREAESARGGYVEDLEKEGVGRMTVQIKQGHPNDLTVCKDE